MYLMGFIIHDAAKKRAIVRTGFSVISKTLCSKVIRFVVYFKITFFIIF
jgi:hypothetical protein